MVPHLIERPVSCVYKGVQHHEVVYISGKVGQWRKYFDEDMNYKMNRMVALKLNASDLHFKYDVER